VRILIAILLLIPQDDHEKDCCREAIHTMEARPCQACGKEGADCRLCKACAAKKGVCSHCLKEPKKEDAHRKNCCKDDKDHPVKTRACNWCSKQRTNCRYCDDCAKYLGACDHCGKEKGFTDLFNDKDLAGWAVIGDKAWSAAGGLIVCSGEGSGWLRSEKEYESFVWRLEYRVSKEDGNSGMFLRATEAGNPAFTGMEIQILADRGKAADIHSSGSLYGSVAPTKNNSKAAGEWNTVEITLHRRALKIVLNGETVLDVPNLDDAKIPFQEKKLSERANKGFIGLQNHHDKVEFRNLRIKEIKE
jgi:hypothetical protein